MYIINIYNMYIYFFLLIFSTTRLQRLLVIWKYYINVIQFSNLFFYSFNFWHYIKCNKYLSPIASILYWPTFISFVYIIWLWRLRRVFLNTRTLHIFLCTYWLFRGDLKTILLMITYLWIGIYVFKQISLSY